MSLRDDTAVLLLAHGTPDTLGEMAEYLACVTRGRPMPAAVVEELQHRYAEIGLGDTPGAQPPPLTRWTFAQRDRLAEALRADGDELPVYAAMRNWRPFIADVVQTMRDDGIRRVLAICLAPQNSSTSIGLYRQALHSASEGLDVTFVDEWADEPALIAAFAQRLLDLYPHAQANAEAALGAPTSLPVLFTAHSVPCRTVIAAAANGGASSRPDPYPVEAKRTAALVFAAAAAKLPTLRSWYFAFQSQGVAGGPWIGPTVEDTLRGLREEGCRAVIVQPIGFLCDHVEILYDIDVAFTRVAHELGMELYRPESLNDSPLLIKALSAVVRRALAVERATGT